jgi:hypothetical protein
MRTLPRDPVASHGCNVRAHCQKRPSIVSKETYYIQKRRYLETQLHPTAATCAHSSALGGSKAAGASCDYPWLAIS